MDPPAVTVVVPTAGRAAYLEVTLDSLRRQRTGTAHEILVIDDGATDATPEVAERFGARLIRHGERRNLNVARNTGVREAPRRLVAFVDDDVFVPPGWLDALVEGAARYPDAEAFGGPIRPRLEGNAPRGCGREDPPITALDLGDAGRGGGDGVGRELRGAPLGLRADRASSTRRLDRLHGDEEDWLLRLRAAGGRIVYLADAGARPPAQTRTTRPSARSSRAASDRGRACALETTSAAATRRASRASCACWSAAAGTRVRRACPQGVVMGAHSAGRVVETLRPR